MNVSKLILILILAMVGTGSVSADNRQSRKYIRHGNNLYRAGKHREALVDYYKAMRADTTNARALYTLSTAMFPDQWRAVPDAQRDTMVNYFRQAAQNETTPYRKAHAYHNMGVVLQGKQDFQNAIEAYKMSLRFNPNDDETRYNLVLCQRQLKKQGGGGKNNQQNKQDEQQDQQKQEQDKQQQQQQQKQDQQQNDQEPPMSKENAEQLLNAVMQQEKQTQQRMQDAKQQQSKRRRIEKNW
jgi:Ca-activated chloride channel family protein